MNKQTEYTTLIYFVLGYLHVNSDPDQIKEAIQSYIASSKEK